MAGVTPSLAEMPDRVEAVRARIAAAGGNDVRIVAALEEGQRDRILPGLFHLLAGVPLRLPPLSERKEDIPMLFAHFAARAAERHQADVGARPEHRRHDDLLVLDGVEPGDRLPHLVAAGFVGQRVQHEVDDAPADRRTDLPHRAQRPTKR